MFRFILSASVAIGITSSGSAMESSIRKLTVTSIVDGLEQPWAFAVLPEGGVLITELGGVLLHVTDTQRTEVAGVPKVWAEGQ